jgi:hypothetical protein
MDVDERETADSGLSQHLLRPATVPGRLAQVTQSPAVGCMPRQGERAARRFVGGSLSLPQECDYRTRNAVMRLDKCFAFPDR